MKNMKKVISIAVIVATLFSVMIPAFASAGQFGGKDMWVYCSNGGRLNIRMDPYTKSYSLAKLPNGTKVDLMEDLGNGWAKVETSEYIGYVQTKFLQSHPLTKYQIGESASSIVPVTPYMVAAKALNNRTDRSVGLRVEPTKACKEIRRLEAGDELQVIARGSVWSKVVDLRTGSTGYVANDYIQVI